MEEHLPEIPPIIVENHLRIHANSSIKDLNGFNHIEEVDTITISGNHDLKDISGFNGIKSISELVIWSNDSLVEISGFNSLIDADLIFIGRTNNLKKISGFNSLKFVNEKLKISNFENLNAPNFTKFENSEKINQKGIDNSVPLITKDFISKKFGTPWFIDDLFWIYADFALRAKLNSKNNKNNK